MNDDLGGTGASQPWNVLVTAQEGAARDLKRLLKRLGAFRSSGFRNVLVGQVAAVSEFCQALATELDRRPFAQAWLGKVLPVHRTFPVDVGTFVTDIEAELATLVCQIGAKSFHVRVERRGHKGVLSTRELEQRLGDYVWGALEAHGIRPVVSFHDPELVVGIEIAGDLAGISLVSRELRHEFPFVKID